MSKPVDRSMNTALWASFVADSSKQNFSDIPLNKELYLKQLFPKCFEQCSRTDIDIVFMPEWECAYKCAVTYRDTLDLLKRVDSE